MNFFKKKSDIVQDTSAYNASLREKYLIRILQFSFKSIDEYIQLMDLNPALFNSLYQNNILNSGRYMYFFEIELKNDSSAKSTMTWTIRRRFEDFLILEEKVLLYLLVYLRLSQKLSEELIEGIQSPLLKLSDIYKSPTEEAPEQFAQAAKWYMDRLLESPEVRSRSIVFYEFLELSLFPLLDGPQKYKEGYLKKKGGGRFKRNKIKLFVENFITNWYNRWFILTEEGLIYTEYSTSTKAREMLLFDQSFRIEYGESLTGFPLGISLITSNRVLNLQANGIFDALDWVDQIQRVAKINPYTKSNRFNSFAPVRDSNHYCQWFVDAKGYYGDLYESLVKAKREIFITDWWLTPEIALKRPVYDTESEYRLDKVLGKVAQRGVKVYVILYHEVTQLMYNSSAHAKQALESLSSNITVLQHPSEPFFSWSHHEKLAIIDQEVGYIGGFDLCFGRMDSNQHPLKDPAHEAGAGETFLGQDYGNPRLVDYRNVAESPFTPLINKQTTPRMPFHDAMIKVVGPAVGDMSRHFIQYWNHVKVDCFQKEVEGPLPVNIPLVSKDENLIRRERIMTRFRRALKKIFILRHLGIDLRKAIPPELPEVRYAKHFPSNMMNLHRTSYDAGRNVPLSLQGNKKEGSGKAIKKSSFNKDGLSPGQENKNVSNLFNDIREKGTSIVNNVMNAKIHLPVFGEIDPKNLVSNIQKYIPKKAKDYTYTADQSNNLTSIQGYNNRNQNNLQTKSSINNHANFSQAKIPGQIPYGIIKTVEQKPRIEHTDQNGEIDHLEILFAPKYQAKQGTCSCQMLRSASKWSLGLNTTDGNVENSIHNAYIHIIQNAKHFIYIENQFFMSSTAGGPIKNEVAKALLQRIERAHVNQEKFRVIVFLPLLPGFEGEIVDPKSTVLKIQIHWQYMTICRGGQSIYEELWSKGIRPEDYIQFYSLRQHGKMINGYPATEMIYIHSKILIADDDVLLIGSANINDRSLQGSGDSEVAMVVEDSKKVVTFMNGVKVQVSEFSHTFRKRLLSEHLGLSEEEVRDPLRNDFMTRMNMIAERNTLIYREIFACYPDDTIRSSKEIDLFETKKNLSKYEKLAPQIQGHIVWFPLKFLQDEQLTAPITAVEYYLPDQTFI